jgi:sulfur carrier protein
MELMVNGERRSFAPAPDTVDALLEALSLSRDQVAVELNGDIVRRAERGERKLADGDIVEVVTLVGGG